jgi:PAS domain S-box-containing protein
MFRLLAVDPSLGAPSLRDLVESLHPEDRDAVSTSLSRLVDTGEPWSAELRSDPARGPVRHLLANALPVRDRDGRLVRVVGTLQDITERKAAEGERELLIHTVESSLNEIYLFDAGNLRFRFANNGALNNLGCSLAEIQSLTPLDIEPELDDASFRKLIEPLLEGTLPLLVFSTVHRRADGSRYPVEVHLQLFERGGDRVFLAVIQDVSERTLLEGQVRQAQKMEAVGRLAGGVAHDFNNMLGVIFGYTEQLMREWPPQDRRHRLLARILEAAERSADLTRQLLAFSRKQVIRPEIVNIDDVVAGTRSMLQRVIGEDVALIMRLAADAERVRVDPGQITQVLLNLAVNARDAMPHGGTLMLETDTLEIDEERPQSRISPPPGRYVELIVSDDGCGMDADTKAKIFDPFFTTKPAGKGTGLGLATVYGIVRQNDGLIDVESAPGTGSSFRILLPCVDAAPAERLPPRPAVEPGGDETILLVEDQAAALDVLSEMLRDLGYRVLTASQGREALEVAARSPGAIDLLLTDVVMPEMSGRELADRLQEVRPGMAVLYMSGYPVDQISHRGVLDYGVDLIEKPGVFRRATLAARVRAALDARRPTRGPGREAE